MFELLGLGVRAVSVRAVSVRAVRVMVSVNVRVSC